MLGNAVPLSTRYKNKWSVNIFKEWIRARENHRAALEQTSLSVSLDDVQDLDVEAGENDGRVVRFLDREVCTRSS